MQAKTINTTENIRTWLRACPLLDKKVRFGVDYLSEKATEYTIISVPSELIYNTYMGGKKILAPQQTQSFIFASRNLVGADTLQNLQNIGFFSGVIAWIYEESSKGNLPIIAEGKALSITAGNTQFLMETDGKTGQYQIQLQLTYRR